MKIFGHFLYFSEDLLLYPPRFVSYPVFFLSRLVSYPALFLIGFKEISSAILAKNGESICPHTPCCHATVWDANFEAVFCGSHLD